MSDERQSEQQPIPTNWRRTFQQIVTAFVAGDYRLATGIPGVEPVSAQSANQIESSIHEYGATLVPLPNETWDSSVCIWAGDHWDVLVDLWSQEEGSSDLVLHAQVTESHPGILVKIHHVYVP